jgi:hypothetical protein
MRQKYYALLEYCVTLRVAYVAIKEVDKLNVGTDVKVDVRAMESAVDKAR